MKILSYKILSEADVFSTSNLLRSKLITQKGGFNTFSNPYFEKIVTLNLSIYKYPYSTNSTRVLDYKNVLFAININESTNEINLYPYYDEEVKALTEENGKKWGTLKLYDVSSKTDYDVKTFFNNPKGQSFAFSFQVNDTNVFNYVNKRYIFANLNQLSNYQTTNINPNFFMGIISTNIKDLSISSNKLSNNNQYSLDIEFNPKLSAVTNIINKIDGYCNVILNNVKGILSRNLPPPSFRKITYIKDGNDIYYIYTNDDFEKNQNTQKDCYVHIKGTGNVQKTKYTLKTFNKI